MAAESGGGRVHPAGFSLVELMIVMAIVAVLASIAYPSYTSHLRVSRRAEAQAYLMDLAQREHQYFTDNRSYALDAGDVTAATLLHAPELPGHLHGLYSIATISRAVTPSFVVTATALGGQAVDGDLMIDDTGSKAPAGRW
jgi:type IV pilus assembly protein PilE